MDCKQEGKADMAAKYQTYKAMEQAVKAAGKTWVPNERRWA